MTITTIAIPNKALQRSEKRCEDGTVTSAWDLYLDGALVASEYTSQLEALMELDLAAWYALFGEAALSPGAPITDEALAIGLTVFNRLFTVDKVQEKARTALEKIIKAHIYTIQADGSLSVLASSGRGRQTSYTVKARTSLRMDAQEGAQETYHVTMECECRDFYVRAREHGGVCKHVAARLLLFLAQLGVGYLKHLRDALDMSAQAFIPPAADISTEGASAFLSIGASDLAAAFFLAARAGTAVEIHAESDHLHLIAETIDLTLPCLDGEGTAAIRLEHAALWTLYEQLRPVARSAGALNLFVEASDGVLFVCDQENTDFSATANGQALPSAARPACETTPEPSLAATPASRTGTPAVEALYELFSLLEQHEPDWYLRKHERIASDALRIAGRIA